MHDTAHDPGGATPSRLAMAHMAAFTGRNQLGLRNLEPFEAALQGFCLRFGPRVTATPARLGSGLPATALAR
jgi:hypothetical protein